MTRQWKAWWAPRKVRWMFACIACGHTSEDREEDGYCPKCGSFDSFASARKRKERTASLSSGPRLASRVVQEKRKLFASGVASWDAVLGGGFARPSSVLVFGPPGVGKTTELACVASRLALSMSREGKDGAPALFVCSEMPSAEVASSAVRGGAELSSLLVWGAEDERVQDIEDVIAEGMTFCPSVVVFDSLQAFRFQGQSGTDAAVMGVVRTILAASWRYRFTALLVSQVTKEGDPWGPRRSMHSVDAIVEMTRAFLHVRTKNRFGKTPVKVKR